MRAFAVFPGAAEAAIVEHDDPAPDGEATVLVQMVSVGICGIDREIRASGRLSTPPDSSYLIVGHEGVGQILDFAGPANGLRPGGFVVPMVRRACSHEWCRPCRAGRPDCCASGDFTARGLRGRHGLLCERIVDEPRYLVPIAAEISDVAMLVEPLARAENALAGVDLIQSRLPEACRHEGGERDAGYRQRALCVGAGATGFLAAMALVEDGYETYVYSREPVGGAKSGIAHSFGAGFASSDDIEPAALGEHLGPIDLVYDASGASAAALAAMNALAPNGVFVFTAIPRSTRMVASEGYATLSRLVEKNQIVLGSLDADRGAYERAAALLGRFMKRWPHAVRALFDARVPLEHGDELLRRSPGGLKSVIDLIAASDRSTPSAR